MDYIPKNDNKFLEWARNMFEYARANCNDWKVGEPSDDMVNLVDDFDTALKKATAPNRGKVDILAKNELRKTLEKTCRSYVQGFLAKNPFVTNVDRENMRLTIYDVIPTTVSNPTGQAEAEISFPGRTQLQLRLKHIAGTPTDAKADYGYRIYHSVFPADAPPPASGKDLRESRFTRQKKALFTFQPEESGKTAYFAIRYENNKGVAGPWGPLFSAIIP